MRLVLVGLLVLLIAAAPASAAKVPKAPSGVAFYTPPAELAGEHGDAIWVRKQKGPAALKAARSNRLLLYRSTGIDGAPIAVSGTVSIPKGKKPKGGWPVISYGHGTTGIADRCAPSRAGRNELVSYAYPLLNGWLKKGYAVLRTDYQGLGTPGDHLYLNGVAEGRAMLDIVRAARQLEPRLSRRYAVAGHSQGGHAALWAASLAPEWAAGLKLRGALTFAPASHIGEQARVLPGVDSPLGGRGAFAALVLRSTDTANPQLNVSSGLSDRVLSLYPQTRWVCLRDLSAKDSFGGLRGTELFKEGIDPSAVQAAIDATDPEDLRIRTLIRIEQGDADATVLPSLTTRLAEGYEALGNRVEYIRYATVDHGDIIDVASSNAASFLKRRLR